LRWIKMQSFKMPVLAACCLIATFDSIAFQRRGG
jgi:hypothetical protein